jgi:hypothetical protein
MNKLLLTPLAGATLASAGIEMKTSLKRLTSGETRQPDEGMFRILSQEDGDERVVWNSHNLGEISDAKRMFDSLVEQGFVPYRVELDGKRSTSVMDEFDPAAEEIIFAPVHQAVGG